MNICVCGEQPRLIEYYIKTNHKNYFVRCDTCKRRTRNRRLKQDAIDEWNEFGERKYMKWQDGISDYYGFKSYVGGIYE